MKPRSVARLYSISSLALEKMRETIFERDFLFLRDQRYYVPCVTVRSVRKSRGAWDMRAIARGGSQRGDMPCGVFGARLRRERGHSGRERGYSGAIWRGRERGDSGYGGRDTT